MSEPAAGQEKTRGHRFLAASVGGALGLSLGGVVFRRRPPQVAEPLPEAPPGERLSVRGPAGCRLHVERLAGTGGTLVFTHGWCLTEAAWRLQKVGLGGNPHRLVTWDLPGHGASTPGTGRSITLDLAVESLARVVDRAADGGEGLVLVGHSLGGAVTLSYLAAHPDTARRRVRGVVIASTPLMHVPRSVAGRWPGAALEASMLHSGLAFAVSNPVANLVLGAEAGRRGRDPLSYPVIRAGFGRAPSPVHVRFVRDLIASVPGRVRTETFHAMRDYDLRGAIEDIRVPALVLLGSRDRLVNPAETRTLARLLPQAESVEFDGAGHALFLERAEEFNGAVAEFARAHLGAPSGRATGGANGSRRRAGGGRGPGRATAR